MFFSFDNFVVRAFCYWLIRLHGFREKKACMGVIVQISGIKKAVSV
jgi:hypothetical protein